MDLLLQCEVCQSVECSHKAIFHYLWWPSKGFAGLFGIIPEGASQQWHNFASAHQTGHKFCSKPSQAQIWCQHVVACSKQDSQLIGQLKDKNVPLFMDKFLNSCHISVCLAGRKTSLHFWALETNQALRSPPCFLSFKQGLTSWRFS